MAGWNVLLVCLTLVGIQAVRIHENVIFYKVSQITTTRSKWLVTFVIDMDPYQEFLKRLTNDVYEAEKLAEQLAKRYSEPGNGRFKDIFETLRREATGLKNLRHQIYLNYDDYRVVDRAKREALIPIVGKALSFLFGTVSESDLKSIKRNVFRLHENQLAMSHVVAESISVINVSRVDIGENRHAINELIASVDEINEGLSNVTSVLANKLSELEEIMQAYSQMDMILAEVRMAINKGISFLEHLELQLNMLSLGHLSPTTIRPRNFRMLLGQVSSQLPPHLELTGNPKTDLWEFYRYLSCATLWEDNKILVVVSLPLLELGEEYEVYKAVSLPFPVKEQEGLFGRYNLEAPALAINAERTRYMLIPQKQLEECAGTLPYCNPRNPVYPVNLNNRCILALFMQNADNVKRFCSVTITRAALTSATYLFDGLWVVSSLRKEEFNVVCGHARFSSGVRYTQPPLAILRLNATCTASNRELMLPPYYHRESKFEINDPFIQLLGLQNTSFEILKPLSNAFVEFRPRKLPKALEDIQEIPMKNMIAKIETLQTRWYHGLPDWGNVIITISVIAVIVVTGYIIYKSYIKYKGYQIVIKTRGDKSVGRTDTGLIDPERTVEPTNSGPDCTARADMVTSGGPNDDPVSDDHVFQMLDIATSVAAQKWGKARAE